MFSLFSMQPFSTWKKTKTKFCGDSSHIRYFLQNPSVPPVKHLQQYFIISEIHNPFCCLLYLERWKTEQKSFNRRSSLVQCYQIWKSLEFCNCLFDSTTNVKHLPLSSSSLSVPLELVVSSSVTQFPLPADRKISIHQSSHSL